MAEVTCDVQLSVDADAIRVQEITIPAAEIDAATGALLPGRNNVVFTPFEQPRGVIIRVANLRPDDLAADDAVRVVVPPPKQLVVGLVAAKSFFLRSALEGLPLQRLELLTAAQYERLARDGGLDAYDLIVFDDHAPPLMPPGRYLSFGRAPPVEGLNESGEADVQIVLSTRDDHPVLRFVGLDDLFILKCRLIQPADDVTVLVEGSRGPLVVAVSRGPMQIIHVAFDLVDSNWPLLRSWVTFLFNAVDYLGHVGDGLTSEGLTVGEALTTRLPASVQDDRLHTPGGAELDLSGADPTQLSWGPIRLAGLHVLRWTQPGTDGEQSRAFAVNVLSEPESRIGSVEKLQIGQEHVEGTAGDAAAYTPLWPYAIGVCLAVLMLEWWVYHRKAFI